MHRWDCTSHKWISCGVPDAEAPSAFFHSNSRSPFEWFRSLTFLWSTDQCVFIVLIITSASKLQLNVSVFKSQTTDPHTAHTQKSTHAWSKAQHKQRRQRMSKSSSSERKDHLIEVPSLGHIFTTLLYWAEGEVCVRVCVWEWVRTGPILKDKNSGEGMMIVLLYTCCKNVPGSVYREYQAQSKDRGRKSLSSSASCFHCSGLSITFL